MKLAIAKQGVILALVALLSTSLIVLTFLLTESRIHAQQVKQRQQLLAEVIPASFYNEPVTESCTLITNPMLAKEAVPAFIARIDGRPTAIAIETVAPDGYSGDIRVLVAVNMQQEILGVRVLSHQETPGLGDKIDIRISDWVNDFIGKMLKTEHDRDFAVKKDGGQFDQFTGATITPRAVTNAVRRALWYVQNHRDEIISQPNNCEGQ